MAVEILLYQNIYSYTAADFIQQLEAAKGKDVVLRINANVGDPEYGWGMIAKLKEHTPSLKIKVDGKAHSMCAFMLCYTQDVEGLDVSTFIIHRAAYGAWYESDPDLFTESRQEELRKINAFLRAGLEAKIDVAKFEKMKGVKLDTIFSTDSRVDVPLTADEAKQIGLIASVVAITPEKKAEIDSNVHRIAAQAHGAPIPEPVITKKQNIVMTIEKLRAEHPEVYASAVAVGVAQEKDRTGAFLAFIDIDAAAVAKGIAEGTSISQTFMAQMTVKSIAAKQLGNLVEDKPADVKTAAVKDTPATTAERAAIDAEWAKFDKNLNIKSE